MSLIFVILKYPEYSSRNTCGILTIKLSSPSYSTILALRGVTLFGKLCPKIEIVFVGARGGGAALWRSIRLVSGKWSFRVIFAFKPEKGKEKERGKG